MMRQRQLNDNASACMLLLLLLLSVYAVSAILGSVTGMGANDAETLEMRQAELSAFQKITLGTPVSINTEGIDGLSAVPGIGPKIASAIISNRGKRGGFESLDDLLSVKGIGPAIYKKIGPYLVL